MKCIIKANMYKKKIEWIKNIPDMAVQPEGRFQTSIRMTFQKIDSW